MRRSPTFANVQDLSQHPVYVRAGNGDFYDGLDFRYQAYWAAQGATVPGSPPLQVVRDGRMGARLINTNYHNFAPRLGIAWSPSDKWSVRTGVRHLLLAGKQELHLRSESRTGRPHREMSPRPPTDSRPSATRNFINTAALPVTIPVGLTWGADHIPAHHLHHAVRAQRPARARQIEPPWRWATTARKAAIWTTC